MINIRLDKPKFVILLIIAVCLITPATACSHAPASTPILPVNPPPPSPISSQSPASLTYQQPVASPDNTAISGSENISRTQPARAVEIMLIHNRGTLARIGCCDPMLYERDEFVVIQNRGDTAQDITGWTLTNLTRGYPTFRFPPLIPCIPVYYTGKTRVVDIQHEGSWSKFTENPAQSELNRLSTTTNTAKPVNIPASEVDWASTSPMYPLDDTPLRLLEKMSTDNNTREPSNQPAVDVNYAALVNQPPLTLISGQQGRPLPCILYPGQTILVFTDEVHCDSGGFSFNWPLGNIWNNEIPDTAVLYNSQGKEVSRRSYTVGR